MAVAGGSTVQAPSLDQGTAPPPTPAAPPPVEQTKYQKWLDAYNVAQATGRTGLMKYLQHGIDRQQANTPGLTGTGLDTSSSTFDINRFQNVRGLLNRGIQARNPGSDPNRIRAGQLGGQAQDILKQNQVREGQEYFDQNVQPTLQSNQQQLQDLISKPALGAEFIAQTRSNIGATVKGAEEARLRRVAASLGMRGLDPSSPAGAAIAAQTAQESDAELARQLTKLGIDTETINRTSLQNALSMSTQNVMQGIQAKNLALNGDRAALFDITNNLNALMDGIRQQRELIQQPNAMAREAGSRDWLGTGLQLGSQVAGSLAMGGMI